MPDELNYLAIPYSHPNPVVREQRFHLANQIAGLLMQKGLHVFSPISHTHPIAVDVALPTGWDYWQRFDRIMLKMCSRLLVATVQGWQESKGVEAEVNMAMELNIPVVFVKPIVGINGVEGLNISPEIF